MKTARFLDPHGAVRTGEWTDDGLRFGGTTYSPDTVRWLAPSRPSKIVCVGLNYADHAKETGKDLPDRPQLFLKAPNAVAAHGDAIRLLAGVERIDYEAELGVIIGRQCKNVPKDKAMRVVAGFTCVNDVSNRDDQKKEQNWVRGKAFDASAPMGPVLVPADEVPKDAAVRLRLNGQAKQDSDITQLIFDVPTLIAEITRYLTLEEGDVISTGTPSGIGPLADGDTVEVEIEGIGTLRNPVRGPA